MRDVTSCSPYQQWQRVVDRQVAELRESVASPLKRASGSDACLGGLGVPLERLLQDIVHGLGRALMKEIFEMADTASPEVMLDGVPWRYRRVQQETYETMFGEVPHARATYQRAGRGRVAVPLELRLGIVEGRYTPLVARIADRSLASMPTNEAQELLHEIGVCRLSRSTLHRLPQAMVAKAAPGLDEMEGHTNHAISQATHWYWNVIMSVREQDRWTEKRPRGAGCQSRHGNAATCRWRSRERRDDKLRPCSRVEDDLAAVKAGPSIVRSFFKAPSVAYILD